MKRRRPIVAGLLAWLVVSACSAPRPVETIRTSGDFEFNRGNYTAAASEYREIRDRFPGDWRAQYMLGLSLIELDRPREAIEALEVAHARRPADDDVADALAEALFMAGEPDRLFAFLRARAAADQAAPDYLRLARYSLKMDDPDSARLAIITAIDLDGGKTVEPYIAAADLAERVQNRHAQVRRLRQAYGIDPEDERVLDALRRLGEVPGPTIALPPGP